MTITGKAWDLSPLVPSIKLEDLKTQMEEFVKEAEQIAEEYKGKITSLTANELKKLINRMQDFFLNRQGVFKYGSLSYDANSLDPNAKQAADLTRRFNMKIEQLLAFTDIEVSQLLESKPELIKNPELAEYKHALEKTKRRAPHMLSDAEEQLIIQKDRFGINSWSQLQKDWLSTRTYEIEINGKIKHLPYGEIISLYEHPNRLVRKTAKDVVWTGLSQDEILWSSAIRAICGDHFEMSKKRNWPTPRTQSLIDNDVDDETIDALMTSVVDHVSLYQRYLQIKAKLMGLSKLGEWDVVAPLPNLPERKITWKEARQITIDTYKGFDPELSQIVQDMFDKKRIDGEVRKGKRSGAFFSSWHKGKTGFIITSYNGILGDLFTLVHENGHAVHGTLMFREQKPENTDISYCMAEVGSIFGELLLAEKLMAEAQTKEEKIAILAKILDEFGMTVFQVSARYFFETDLYAAFEQGEYLDSETISRYWVKGRDKIYGDVIEWLPNSKWEWTFKGHYYIPNFRYYNYPYVFANLFVFALYRLYKEQGKDFVPKLRRLLSAGSTLAPRDLAAELGFDISTTDFWALGMKQAEQFVNELEGLIKD
ncbi:MAG: M3 family oligoendopeptidase [Candidatus Thorarchaeota archaeon]